MYLFTGFLKFLLGVTDRYCSDMQGKEGDSLEHRADFILKQQQDRARASGCVGCPGTSVLGWRNWGGKWRMLGGRVSMWSMGSDLGVAGAWLLEADIGIWCWESRAVWTVGGVVVWIPPPRRGKHPGFVHVHDQNEWQNSQRICKVLLVNYTFGMENCVCLWCPSVSIVGFGSRWGRL